MYAFSLLTRILSYNTINIHVYTRMRTSLSAEHAYNHLLHVYVGRSVGKAQVGVVAMQFFVNVHIRKCTHAFLQHSMLLVAMHWLMLLVTYYWYAIMHITRVCFSKYEMGVLNEDQWRSYF